MYSISDIKRSARRQFIDDFIEYVQVARTNATPINDRNWKNAMLLKFQDGMKTNMEYELWLVNNLGIDVAVNMCQYYAFGIDSSEKFFCRTLALQSYTHLLDVFQAEMIPATSLKIGVRKYSKWIERAEYVYKKSNNEVDSDIYGNEL